MATKSFKKELTFSAKTADKFLQALDNSRKVDIKSKHIIEKNEDASFVASIIKSAVKG